ncbi:MAG: energy-coupling factor transporter transmembrane component T [Anaerolineae bacterium]
MRLHYLAWVIWVLGAATAAVFTRNPLYLLLLLGSYTLLTKALAPSSAGGTLRFAAYVIPTTAMFNLLTAHVGTTVLYRLPAGLPLLGGPLTAEALVYGALNGLLLTTLFAAFRVLDLALSVHDLIALVPRAFYPVAVVISIAVTFVPTLRRQLQQIREAQAIRGHRMRGLRDWLPLFLPLLVGGLERALRLAEALTVRGFVAITPAPDTPTRLGLVSALALLLLGLWLRLTPGWDAAALACSGAGGLLFAALIYRLGRRTERTTYRSARWSFRDSGVTLGALLALVGVLLDPATRTYTPYPTLTAPPFNFMTGLALLALATPLFIGIDRQER